MEGSGHAAPQNRHTGLHPEMKEEISQADKRPRKTQEVWKMS